jgi:hypothetical protein
LVSGRKGIVSESGGALDPRVLVSEPTHVLLNGFISWRSAFPAAWMEIGVRVFDILGADFHDAPGLANTQNENYFGGEELDRRVTLFVRGGI